MITGSKTATSDRHERYECHHLKVPAEECDFLCKPHGFRTHLSGTGQISPMSESGKNVAQKPSFVKPFCPGSQKLGARFELPIIPGRSIARFNCVLNKICEVINLLWPMECFELAEAPSDQRGIGRSWSILICGDCLHGWLSFEIRLGDLSAWSGDLRGAVNSPDVKKQETPGCTKSIIPTPKHICFLVV